MNPPAHLRCREAHVIPGLARAQGQAGALAREPACRNKGSSITTLGGRIAASGKDANPFHEAFLMIVRDAVCVLPGVRDVIDDFLNANTVLHLGKDERSGTAHFACITSHDFEVGANGFCKIGFVDDKQIALGDARSALPRNFVPAGDVDDLDGKIGQLTAETGGEIIAA